MNEKGSHEESYSAQSEQSGDDSNNDDDWDDESERFKSTSDSEEFSTSIIPGYEHTISLCIFSLSSLHQTQSLIMSLADTLYLRL